MFVDILIHVAILNEFDIIAMLDFFIFKCILNKPTLFDIATQLLFKSSFKSKVGMPVLKFMLAIGCNLTRLVEIYEHLKISSKIRYH